MMKRWQFYFSLDNDTNTSKLETKITKMLPMIKHPLSSLEADFSRKKDDDDSKNKPEIY